MNVVPYFAVLALLVGALLVLYRLPYARFLLHRIRQHSWPAVEATLSRAGIVSVVLKDSVQWDSVFQVSYEANGKPVFAYYGLHSYDCEPTEAQSLQTTWDGAKVIVRYDPKQPEGFVLDKNYTGGYHVVYMPEFSGSSLAGSPDPLALPKNLDSQEPS